jgi:hypothetical protein
MYSILSGVIVQLTVKIDRIMINMSIILEWVKQIFIVDYHK